MTEKVKLTQEQVEAIEMTKKWMVHADVIKLIVKGTEFPNAQYRPLSSLRLEDLLKVLYEPNSYEVELQYMVGDWVVYPSFDAGKVIVKVIDIQYVHSRVQFETLSGWKAIRDIERHATPEEIKDEKERQMWAKIGREVGEFHVGDITLDQNYYPIRVVNVEMGKTFYQQTKRIGFYPAESFISFEEVDSE